MLFSDPNELRPWFEGKSVAVVGSGPGVLDNEPGFVDSHEVVVRVNNYRTSPAAGFRTDVFYSFFGGSIKKTVDELKADGVKLCVCKCPDSKFIESEWHKRMGKERGTDFRYIYRDRADWWFCPTYVPQRDEFMAVFEMLDRHIPSTGFSALYEVMKHGPQSILITGFDFFASRVHNVNEPWRPGNPDDPIGHSPEREREWLARRYQLSQDPDNERQPITRITMDKRLTEIMGAM